MQAKFEHLVLYNFKSFRGRVHLGPIKGFAVIAGANGTGKSNIMDALSFVMGANAKSMRVRRLSDLIYGATTNKPNGPRSAYVTASFALDADTNRNFTRTIRNASSEYKINEQVVSYEEYCAQLREIGIILNGRNCLVAQGTVESIIMKSSNEWTVFFEELSGSIEYSNEYKRLSDELRNLHDQLHTWNALKKSSLAVKDASLKEKKNMEKYEMLYDKLMKLESCLQVFELYHIKKELEDCVKDEKEEAVEIDQLVKEKNKISAAKEKTMKEAMKVSPRLEEMEKETEDISDMLKSVEAQFNSVRDQVAHWEAKLKNANSMATEARTCYEAHKKAIQELEVELKELEERKQQFEESVAAELSSQGSSVELSDAQVAEYTRLKLIIQDESLVHAKKIKDLEQEQEVDQCRLENEERKKDDLKHKLQYRKMVQEQTEMRLTKLQDFVTITENNLASALKRKQELVENFKEYKARRVNIETELNKINNQRKDAVYDKEATMQARKLTETVQLLRNFCGSDKVHGRVFELYKPVHSRYKVAVTKVFGKYFNAIIVDTCDTAQCCIRYLKERKIGIETFIPLDNLKVRPLKESLRNINAGVKNLKLINDVIQVSSDEFTNALLFIAENTLVCETPEDARKVAWDLSSKHTCVALDGTLYRENGTFTGGLADLEKKAKLWEENDLEKLKVEQTSLRGELRNLMLKTQGIESDINTTEAEIRGCTVRLKHSKVDVKKSMDSLAVTKNEIKIFSGELNFVLGTIESINFWMEERNQSIQSIQKLINKIEDRIYAEFCRKIGVSNIRQYEQRNLIQHEEPAKTRLKFEKLLDRIRSLLDYEKERDIKSILKTKEKRVQTITLELKKARREEAIEKLQFDKAKEKMQEHVQLYTTTKTRFVDLEKKINNYKEELKTVSRLIRTAERKHIETLAKIEKGKAAGLLLMKNSKISGINIPLLSDETNASTVDSTERDTSESLLLNEILRVDFSTLPADLKTDNVSNSREELKSKIAEVRSELSLFKKPDIRIDQRLESTVNTFNEAKKKSKEVLQQLNVINAEFEQVKEKRLTAFNTVFERVSAELEQTYKSLYNNPAAAAMIVPENSSEPYIGGLHIHCMVPGKRWLLSNCLSGGEKTLASLAILYTFKSSMSAPFFALDEIDASLDDVAVNKLINFIREKKGDTPFIVVSLGKMKYYGDILFGVTTNPDSETMESTVLTLDPSNYPPTE